MGLSANTLFHFTELNYLKSILKNGFYSRCSVEQVAFSDHVFPVAFLMVSFCDIRFSQLTEHLSHYNEYGIGLSKSWGIRKGINPVFYIEKKTFPHALIKTMVTAYFKITNNKDNPALNLSSEEKKEFTALLQLIAYCKVNNTQRWDKEKNEFYGDEINFYNEREWRYFPGIVPSDNPDYIALPFIPIIKDTVKFNFAKTIEMQNKEAESKPLAFTNNDIKYIIVKNDDEINELIQYLRNENLFQDSFDILVSKITTAKRIKEDH